MEDTLKELKEQFEAVEQHVGWNVVFNAIRNESSKYEYACGEAKAPENRLLNRYRDVSPFDHSRVVLKNGQYINASLVKVDITDRNYILTQGALPHTSGHFWAMVWEQQSRGVLMLNKIIEKNQIKCHQYWPAGTQNSGSDTIDYDDVGLRIHLKSEEPYRHFIIRHLVIEEIQTGDSREVLQFHYTHWPDFGVPATPRAFLHFLQVVRDSGVLDSDVGPAIVHCSAGIGRSGTFCLVDSCLLRLAQGHSVDVKDVLISMRKYRTGLIQTAEQLRFSYLAILEGVQQLADGNEKFLPDPDNLNGTSNGTGVDHEDALPRPPPRTTSSNLTSPFDDQCRRLIEMMGMSGNDTSYKGMGDRPLPEIPPASSSSECDSSDESEVDEILEVEEDEEETTSTSYGLWDHIKDERKSSVSEVENLVEDAAPAPGPSASTEQIKPEEDQNNHKVNGIDEGLHRRAKNEKTMEKIREIRTKQKEAEAYQEAYKNISRSLFTGRGVLIGCLAVTAVALCYYLRS